MSLRKLARRVLIVPLTACVTLAGALIAAPPSQAVRLAQPVRLTQSMAPHVPSGAARVGTLSPSTKLSIEVALNVPDQARLTAFLNGLTDPQSPFYQQFLQRGQFGPRFGPSLEQVAAVENALRSAGLSPGDVSANRLAIPVTATAAAIEHAFGITLDSYRLPGGRLAYANAAAPKVSAAVAPLVQGVLGLDDVYPEQHLDSRPPGTTPTAPAVSRNTTSAAGLAHAAPSAAPRAVGPQPCAAATLSLADTANYIAALYGVNLLYDVNDLGKGSRIGVLELEPNLRSDITAYKACYGISTKVNYLKVDGGVGSGAGAGEAALDIEMVAGLAPKSTIDVYQAPNNDTGFYDDFKKFVTSDVDKVLSVSWGSCEVNTVVASMKAQELLFEQANAQGQTIFAAAGDEGSTSCYSPSASTANDTLSALSPASAPYVIGVGGTSFGGSNGNQQVVWNDSGEILGTGAGGGGVSTIWCMPSYQDQARIPGVINADSQKDNSKSCKSKYYRESPDISALADPVFGYAVYYDGSWEEIGGTSAATPVWASIAALIRISPWCTAYRSKGATLPQNLYRAVAAHHSYVYGRTPQVVRDITSGNNDYTPSGYTGGLYPATKGYDMASGLGTPMVSGLLGKDWYVYRAGLTQVLCHETATRLKTVKVSRVVPNSGKAGKKVKVTVHGTGFLPVSYADKAEIVSGRKVLASVYAFCSTTACRVTLPAESARTVQIQIYASSLWPSRLTRADRFTYKRK
jgi:subtilase family serine protease